MRSEPPPHPPNEPTRTRGGGTVDSKLPLEVQGQRLVGSAKNIGGDQRRFAAPAHHDFWTFFDGGPAFEASWPQSTLKKAMALLEPSVKFAVRSRDSYTPAPP